MSDPTDPQRRAEAPAPGGALARRDAGSVAVGDRPDLPVRRAMPAMLEASASAYGDVVEALLSDLHGAAADVASLAWLAGSDPVLRNEALYRNAVAQLAWWDALLGALPYPRLQSDLRRHEVDQHRAACARARLLARDEAVTEHGEDADPTDRERQAVEALGPAPVLVPIVADDLDPTSPTTCFFAVDAMRTHPELGPRARAMDAALASVLRSHFALSRRAAEEQARLLTDIFWVALRRALDAGSHQLATTVHLLASANEAPISTRFAREVLESWQHQLLSLKGRPPSLGQRIGRLLGRAPAPELPARSAPRLLTDDDR